MTLPEAMQTATAEVLKEEGLTSVEQINSHNCFNWAFRVFNLVPGTKICGHNIDGEGQSFIEYQGRFYDAEYPSGVSRWWLLPSFQRMFTE